MLAPTHEDTTLVAVLRCTSTQHPSAPGDIQPRGTAVTLVTVCAWKEDSQQHGHAPQWAKAVRR